MRSLPCPHCHERPASLDMHLRFECPKLVGRSRYQPPVEIDAEWIPPSVLDKFFIDLDQYRFAERGNS